MKAKTTKVAIPRGWRKLRNGERRKAGDRVDWKNHPSGWATLVWKINNNQTAESCLITIRKTTARPRSRKVSKVGGSA